MLIHNVNGWLVKSDKDSFVPSFYDSWEELCKSLSECIPCFKYERLIVEPTILEIKLKEGE